LKKVKKWFISVLTWLLAVPFSIALTGAVLLSVPALQNKLFGKLLLHIGKQTGYHLSHKHFSYTWFKGIILTGLKIKDPSYALVSKVNRINIKANLFDFIWRDTFIVQYIGLKGAQINILTQDNMAKLIPLLTTLPFSSSKTRDIIPFKIEKISLDDFSFLIADKKNTITHNQAVKNHFQVDGLHVTMSHIAYENQILTGHIQQLNGYFDLHDLSIHQLHGSFKVTPKKLMLQHVHLKTNDVFFQGAIDLAYEDLAALYHQPTATHFDMHIIKLKLSSQSIAKAIPYLKNHDIPYFASGHLFGNIGSFQFSDFYLAFGAYKSYLKGNAYCNGLPDWDALDLKLDLHQSKVYTVDLLPYISTHYHKLANRLQQCHIDAILTGNKNHFTSKGHFKTDIGSVFTDFVVELTPGQATKAKYHGAIHTQNFQLGKYVNMPQMGTLTMQTVVDGHGLQLDDMQMYLQTKVERINYQGRTYKNLQMNGLLLPNAGFEGNIAIEDQQLIAKLYTKLDWGKEAKYIKLLGELPKIALNAIGLGKKDIQLSSQVDIQLQGSSWDDFAATATLNNIKLESDNQSLFLNNFYLQNGKVNGRSNLSITTDVLNMHAQGAINYPTLIKDLRNFVNVYKQHLSITGGAPNIVDPKISYNFSCLVEIKDINPWLIAIAPQFQISPMHVNVQFNQNKDQSAQLIIDTSEIAQLRLGPLKLQQCKWRLNALQQKEHMHIIANSHLHINKQQWNNTILPDQCDLLVNWIDNHIVFKNQVGNEQTSLAWQLAGQVDLTDTTMTLHCTDTQFRLLDAIWHLHPAGSVTFHPTYTRFHNILFTNEAQQISLEGKLSSITVEKLIFKMSHFSLANLNQWLPNSLKLQGTANGILRITGLSTNPMVTSDIKIQNIQVADAQLGDLHTQTDWDQQKKTINLLGELTKQTKKRLDLKGHYAPYQPQRPLNLTMQFVDAPLEMLAPFVSKIFSHITGSLDGRLTLIGPLNQLSTHGALQLKDANLEFAYLKAMYKCHGDIVCTDNTFLVQNLVLTDDQQGKAILNGHCKHHYLKDFTLGLTGDMQAFKLLNTSSVDNEYFYGHVMATGNIKVNGPFDNITIIANAVTMPNTSLTIPILKKNRLIEREEFIHFTNLATQQKPQKKKLQNVPLQKINLLLKVKVTPDAKAVILLNGKENDTILCKGKGLLDIKSDAEGNLNLSGRYSITEGVYNFSVYDLVKKQFKILPGGSITWLDSPYDGELAVRATYEQLVFSKPLLIASNKKIIEDTKLPVCIELDLTGALSVPDIRFSIIFPQPPSSPSLQEAINAFEAKLAMDESYLKNQVFSLIMFNTFSVGNMVNLADNSNPFQQRAAEFLSQQLSKWVSKLNENLSLYTELDIANLSNNKQSNIPIKISYHLWEGKLFISRTGKINLNEQGIDLANLLGNWSIEYGLTQDNRLRLKMNLMPALNNLETSKSDFFNQEEVLGRMSLLYVKSFNKWRDFFSQNKAKTAEH